LTLGLVAAGVIAKKLIRPVQVTATLLEAGGSTDIEAAIEKAVQERDSIGGVVGCTVTGVPAGLGEPFFDSVESLISHMMFSIPAVKGLEFGSGFAGSRMRGSENNDVFISAEGKTLTNNSGGINGGISNGNEIVFRVAVKPTSSTHQKQHTINLVSGQMVDLEIGKT
jgi:chorismate synthase